MKKVIRDNDYFLLFSCILLGVIAEVSFFRSEIGLAYLLFVSVFYLVFFLRFRLSTFHHRRVGLLFMAVIWLLSATYLFFGKTQFYYWNLFMIPFLMLIHIIIITRPNTFVWQTVYFIKTVGRIVQEAMLYLIALLKKIKMIMKEHQVLVVIVVLVYCLTIYIWSIDLLLYSFRALAIGTIIFTIFQVLRDQQIDSQQYKEVKHKRRNMPSSLAMIGTFFMGVTLGIIGGLCIPAILFIWKENNLSVKELNSTFGLIILLTVLTFIYFYLVLDKVAAERVWHKVFLRIVHSIFILTNVLFIALYFISLRDSEALTGLSRTHFMQYAILFYFMIMYMYTLIRIWLKRISLTHFYFIFSLLFYSLLNIVYVEQIVAEHQYNRYLAGERVDLEAFTKISYPGYQKLYWINEREEYETIDERLTEIVEKEKQLQEAWQSYNFARENWLSQDPHIRN